VKALEDRLRDAYQAVAGTIDAATIPAPPAVSQSRSALRRGMRVIVPLAAAVAVTVMAITTAIPLGVAPRHHPRPATTGAAGPSGFPPFIVVATGPSLKVVRTGTGTQVASIAAPAGQKFEDVASGGAAQTFLTATGPAGSAPCSASFYQFGLSATGQPSPLTFLRVVSGSLPTAVAGVAGGGYAYSAVHCDPSPPNGLIGISDSAGNRTWAYDEQDDYTNSLGVTADAGTLALSLLMPQSSGDRLLNTQSSAATVDEASRAVPSAPYAEALAISPDGATVYACVAAEPRPELDAYHAATGSLLTVLHQWPQYSSADFACQVSADPAGRFLLIATGAASTGQVSELTGVNLRTGVPVTLPVYPDFPGIQVAW
jgi:hypothetical protein